MEDRSNIYTAPCNSGEESDKSSTFAKSDHTTDVEKGPLHHQLSLEKNLSSDEEDHNVEGYQPIGVQRRLKARHVSMISLGGTIGAGLFIGTGSALSSAGPIGALIAYLFIASIVYSIAQSLGEMATFIPITGSFTQFASRFISPSFGAAVGWLYWFSWAMTFAIELNAAAMVIEYWTSAVPVGAWIAIFFVLLTVINLVAVKYYGEIEFWAASVKVTAIVGWLIYAFCMVCGAGQTGPVGFRYWRHPGPFGEGILSSNINTGRFLGWLSALVNAAFTYQGTELVGITAGESTNPRKNVPKAINKVFFRILIFYIFSITFIGLLVPYNDPKLSDTSTYISSSPFVVAIVNSGTKILPSIFNAVILTTVLSAGNSDVYIGSRVLYALSCSGVAPGCFQKTNKQGVPYIGVLCTAVLGALAFMSLSTGADNAFNWLLNISTVAGMIAWCSISLAHMRFISALKVQGFIRGNLPFISKGGVIYIWYALVCNVIIVFIQGFTCFFDFSAQTFLTAYVSLFVFVFMWGVFQLLFQCPLWMKAEDIDLDSGRIEVERIVWDEEKPSNMWERIWDIIV